jgi:hypothetical protein
MDDAERAFIQKLKNQPSRGLALPSATVASSPASIFPGRDELVFYQQGDRALLFDVTAAYDERFATRKIKRWDNHDEVTAEELRASIERVAEVFRKSGRTNPPPGWQE